MYLSLLSFHSFFRWLVVTSLVLSVCRGIYGASARSGFTVKDDLLRRYTTVIAQVQLAVGFVLYFKSPLIRLFFSDAGAHIKNIQLSFFGIYHALCMFSAIIVITIGSAVAKRRSPDRDKFRTMAIWFSIALLIIFAAIPWPFSPFANRPYIRPF